MIGFIHGVRVFEIASTGGNGAPLGQPDVSPPRLVVPRHGLAEAQWTFKIALVAPADAALAKRPGADGALFHLDDDGELTFPAQDPALIGTTFVCPLRAIDLSGNVTDFSYRVTIIAAALATLLNTRTDSTLPGSAVQGFMAAAQALVDVINAQG